MGRNDEAVQIYWKWTAMCMSYENLFHTLNSQPKFKEVWQDCATVVRIISKKMQHLEYADIVGAAHDAQTIPKPMCEKTYTIYGIPVMAQISLNTFAVWSGPSLHVWGSYGTLGIHRLKSEGQN